MLDMLGLSVSTRHECDNAERGSWICEAVGKPGQLDELCLCEQREAKGLETLRGQGDKEKPTQVTEQ